MKEYEGKSLEELRWEDYQANRKGPQGNQSGSSLFGSPLATPVGGGLFGSGTMPTSSTPLFGQTESKSVFGSASSAFGQSSSSFGTPQTSTSGGLFGKPLGFGANTSTTSSFTFNPNASTNLFGQNNKPFGQNTTSTNLFGAQPQTTAFGSTPFGSFGTNTNQNTNLFQQKTTMPFSMGVNTSSTGFSAFSTPGTATTQSGLFTGVKPNTSFGFGQTSTAAPMFGTNTFGQSNQPFFNSSFNKSTGGLFGATNQPSNTNLGSLGSGTNFFGGTAQKPGNLFGTNTMFNTGFGTGAPVNSSFMMSGNTSLQQGSLIPATQNTFANNEQQILALAANPFGLSPYLSDVNDPNINSNIENMSRPTNQQEIKQLLTTVTKPLYKEISGISNKLVPKQIFGKKETMFDGLEQKDIFEKQQTFRINSSNPKRLVLRQKDRYKISGNVRDDEMITLSSRIDDIDTSYSSSREDGDDCSGFSEIHSISLNSLDFTDSPIKRRDKPIISGRGTMSAPELALPVSSSTEVERNEEYEDAQQYLDDSTDETFVVMKKADTTAEAEQLAPVSAEANEDLVNIVHSTEPHPTGIVLTRPEYYTKPTLDELVNYIAEDGSCVVQGFTIGRIGYGNVRFSDAFDVSNLNLDELVFFRDKEINIYPDEINKPPIGQGLNRKAQVTLDRVWPYNKKKKCVVRDIDKLVRMEYAERLRSLCEKQNTRFVEYRPDTGSWVFKVEHFSKYGHRDSDDSDDFDDSDSEQKTSKDPNAKPKTTQVAGAPGVVDNQNVNVQPVEEEILSMGIAFDAAGPSTLPDIDQKNRCAVLSKKLFFDTEELFSSTPQQTPVKSKPVTSSGTKTLAPMSLDSSFRSVATDSSSSQEIFYDLSEGDSTPACVYEEEANIELTEEQMEIPKIGLMKATFFNEGKETLFLSAQSTSKRSLDQTNFASFEPSSEESYPFGKFLDPSFQKKKTLGHRNVHTVVNVPSISGISPLPVGDTPEGSITTPPGSMSPPSEELNEPHHFRSIFHPRTCQSMLDKGPELFDSDEGQEDAMIALSGMPFSIPVNLMSRGFCDMHAFKAKSFKVGWSRDMTLITNSLKGMFPDEKINMDTNGNRFSSHVRSSSVHVVRVSNFVSNSSEEKVTNLKEQLQCQLRNSKYTLKNDLPSFEPEIGYELLESNKNLMQNIYINTKDQSVKYSSDVWSLCNALWGNMDEQDVFDLDTTTIRKKQVGDWLKEAVSSTVQETVDNLRQRERLNLLRGYDSSGDSSEDNNIDGNMLKIMSYLSGHLLEEAASSALSTGNPKLSLFISQLPLTREVKSYFLHQLNGWQLACDYDRQPLININMVRLYMLLAGESTYRFSWGQVELCENLDWLRAFAVYYWYLYEPADFISDVVQHYENAFTNNSHVAYPHPRYESHSEEMRDLIFHLLKYHCDNSYPMQVLLNPFNHTADPLDFSLCWFLLQTFTSLQIVTYSCELHQYLCLQFATQLESMDLWHWAIFILLFLKDHCLKLHSVKRLLCQYIRLESDENCNAEYKEREEMLLQDFHLSHKWIDSAKADRALHLRKYHEAIHYLKNAGRLDEMHKLLFAEVLPELYIACKYSILIIF